MNLGNDHAIVGHWNPLMRSCLLPVLHFPGIKGAATAMDDHLIGAEVLGEFSSRSEIKLKLLPSIACEPAGNLHRANIVTLTVVAAALADQDPVPFL